MRHQSIEPEADPLFRKVFIERFHRRKQRDEASLADRLNHKTIAVAMHHSFVAGQFEFYRDPHRLIAAVSE
jgi:hypothetical protein